MTSRQQDHNLRPVSSGQTRDQRPSIISIVIPLLAGILVSAAILAGASTTAVLLICAVGAIGSSAAIYLSWKPQPVTAPVPQTETKLPPVLAQARDQACNTAREDQLREDLVQEEYRKRRLQYEQMIEAVNNLTGVITHNMGQRLEVIDANIEAVADQLKEQPHLRRKLKAAQTAIGKASALMAKLASFTNQKDWQAQRIDLTTHLSSTVDLVQRSLLSETTCLDMQLATGLWPVEIDPDQFQMAIINITLNAREAMPRGGTIRLTGRNVFLKDDKLKLYGDFVEISVSDTGSGITPENIGKVFRPFFTTKELRNGSGIGLPQVKTFAMRVNGDVAINSTPDEGTIVSLYIPRAPDDGGHTTKDVAQPKDRRIEVLIADDEKDVAAALENMVTTLGHSVRTATSPIAALTSIRTDHPDLVVADITMPGTLDGITLGRQLRHHYPRMPIILMTDNPLISIDSSDFSVLQKPVTREQLETALQQYLTSRNDTHGII